MLLFERSSQKKKCKMAFKIIFKRSEGGRLTITTPLHFTGRFELLSINFYISQGLCLRPLGPMKNRFYNGRKLSPLLTGAHNLEHTCTMCIYLLAQTIYLLD